MDNFNSFLGSSFDNGVKTQINVRQKKMFQGTTTTSGIRNQEIIKFQNTSAWLRLASSVNINSVVTPAEAGSLTSAELYNTRAKEIKTQFGVGDGSAMAKKTILAGGIVEYNGSNLIGREGFKNEGDTIWTLGSYGFGGSTFGYKPSPFVQGAEIKYLNDGALAQATIKIKCFSVDQLDIIDTMYLKVGYTILLEWGHTNYFDNNETAKSVFDSNIVTNVFSSFFTEGTTPDKIYENIKKERVKSSYNYDAFYGTVINFKYSFNKDGSYDVQITAHAQGSIIEGLNLNTSVNEPYTKTEEVPVSPAENNALTAILQKLREEGGGPSRKFTTFNTRAIGIFGKEVKGSEPNVLDFRAILNGPTYERVLPSPYYSKDVDLFETNFLRLPTDKTWNPTPYILFGALLKILENNFSVYGKDKQDKKLKFDTTTQMYYTNGMLSGNPKVCLVPIRSLYYFLEKNGMVKEQSLSTADLNTFYYAGGILDYAFACETTTKSRFVEKADVAMLGGVAVSFEAIFSSLEGNINVSTGKVNVVSFLETLLSNIAGALGGINKFRIMVDGNTVYIVDETILVSTKTVNSSLAKFATYGAGSNNTNASFLTDIQFTTSITNEMASQIAIAAQANANKIGENATALTSLNRGLMDRINPVKFLSEKDKTDTKKLKSMNVAIRKYFLNVYTVKPKAYDTDPEGGVGLTDDAIARLQNIVAEYTQYLVGFRTIGENKYESPFFFPFELTLTMMGLSGMRIYEKFKVDDRVLPSYYRNHVAFITFNVSHTIENNRWQTQVRAYALPISK